MLTQVPLFTSLIYISLQGRKGGELPLLKTPSDYFENSTVLLNELPALASHRTLPSNVHLISPLTPPCTPCEKMAVKATIIVVGMKLNAVDTRTLIRGLSLARDELQSYYDTLCHKDNPELELHQDTCAAVEKLTDFDVVWQLQPNSSIPELVPSFVSGKSRSALEIAASNPGSVAAVSHCDSESHQLFALGMSLLCIPTSDGQMPPTRLEKVPGMSITSLESKAIADTILQSLIHRHERSDNSTSGDLDADPVGTLVDGGNLATQIIETIAYANKVNGTHLIVRRDATPPMIEKSSPWTGIGAFLVFVVLHQMFSHKSGPLQYLKLHSPSFEMLRYLDELKTARYFVNMWYTDENALHNRLDRRFRPESPTVDNHPSLSKKEGTAHGTRKRRSTKKR